MGPPSLPAFNSDSRLSAAYSEGAGIFRIVPAAVAQPRTVPELTGLLRAAKAAGLPVVPRGGGTGMSGGNVGEGLVLDLQALLLARLTRRQARRWQARLRWRRASFHGVPVLFANSFPKSGTHLLIQVLEGFTLVGPAVNAGLPAIVTYMGDSGRERSETEILHDLQRLLPGDIAYGHAHALQAAVELLRKAGYATYFMLRDPRDVVVSHEHYITEMEPGHIHHYFYKEEFYSFDERLMVSILGRPEIGIEFPDIRQRFLPYLGWIECPAVQVLRFEEFVQDRQATVSRALDYAVERGFQLPRRKEKRREFYSWLPAPCPLLFFRSLSKSSLTCRGETPGG